MNDFKNVETMKYWCQKVLPLVYDDSLSYYEVLNKVVNKLNDLISNNDKLPVYIQNLIEQYISSGAIGEVVRDVLTNFMLNVKNPPNDLEPAKGDGSADDTEAIQGCIDYASKNGGMCVYFPSGVYLTHPLTIKENVSLFGFDRYNTRLVLRGGATTSLLTGNVTQFSMSGMTLDGNMDIQVNNVNLIDMNVESAIFSNMLLTDGYKLIRLTVNKILQLNNIIFDYSVIQHIELNGDGSVSASNIYMHNISTLKGVCLLEVNNNNSTFTNMFALGDTPLGYKIGGNDNFISGVIKNATTPYSDTGNNNTIKILGVTETNKMTGDYTINSNNNIENVKGKKTINADEVIIDSIKPLDYKEPSEYDEYFKTIPFKHGSNNYDVLVKGNQSVKGALENLNQAIVDEALTREESDNALETSINEETQERIDADLSLKDKIETETAERQQACSDITNALNDVKEKIFKTNAKFYGAIGDGKSHPLSEKFETITQAREVYPFAFTLEDEIDWCAIQKALTLGIQVYIPEGLYIINRPIHKNRCQTIYGDGGSYPVVNGNTNERKSYGTVIKKITAQGYTGLESYARGGTTPTYLGDINAIIIEATVEWDYENVCGCIRDICLYADENVEKEKRATGLYLFRSVNSNYSNILMYNVYDGVNGHDYFKVTFSNIVVTNGVNIGINLTATSNKLTNCYVTKSRVGYVITGFYHHLDNCACDYVTDISYWVKQAQGVKITGCGQELCLGNKFRIDKSDCVTIDTCFASGDNTLETLILPDYNQSGATLNLPAGEREYTVIVNDRSNVVFINTIIRPDSTKNIESKQIKVSKDSNVEFTNTVIGRKDWTFYEYIPNTYNQGVKNDGLPIITQVENNGITTNIGTTRRWLIGPCIYLLGNIYTDGLPANDDPFVVKFRDEHSNAGTRFLDPVLIEGENWNNPARPSSLYTPISLVSLVTTGVTYQGGIDPVDGKLRFYNSNGDVMSNNDVKTFASSNQNLRFFGIHVIKFN